MLKFYTYFRNTAAYRVGIVLNLKGLEYESIPIHLVKGDGGHLKADYLSKNTSGLVSTMQVGSQSMVTIEYLEKSYPKNLCFQMTH